MEEITMNNKIGFTGSRKLTGQKWQFAHNFASQFQLDSVNVGCAKGLDTAIRTACPLAIVHEVQFPITKHAFINRSKKMTHDIEFLFAFPDTNCPAGIFPDEKWKSGNPTSGSWSTSAYAAYRNVTLYVYMPLFTQAIECLPQWPGSWQASKWFKGFFQFTATSYQQSIC